MPACAASTCTEPPPIPQPPPGQPGRVFRMVSISAGIRQSGFEPSGADYLVQSRRTMIVPL